MLLKRVKLSGAVRPVFPPLARLVQVGEDVVARDDAMAQRNEQKSSGLGTMEVGQDPAR